MKLVTLFLALILSVSLTSQSTTKAPCGAITEWVPTPAAFAVQNPLPPDPCDALASYGTERNLSVSVTPTYREIKKRIRVVVETMIDPDDCSTEVREISRDTLTISEDVVYSASSEPTGGYWTVRMELRVIAPVSRPDGCFSTKLPKGSTYCNSTGELKDYWVTHTGHYKNQEEAKRATIAFKYQYPEFCRAYAYFLPAGCEYQYAYTKKNL